MGGIIRGDVAEATDVMVPEDGNSPAPQITEQQKQNDNNEQVTEDQKGEQEGA